MSAELALDARATAAGELEHLCFGHHGRVAWRCHRQGTVCGTVFHRGLQWLAREQAVDQSGGERVATAHPVQDLKTLPVRRLHDSGGP